VISVVLDMSGGLPELTWQPGIVLSRLPSYSYVRPEPVDCGHSCVMGCEGCAMAVRWTGEGSSTEVPSV
jgi:hypothetical protein